MVDAIITHEIGGNPYAARRSMPGLRLAGVVAGGRAAVTRSGTARAAAGTAAAGVGGVAATEVLAQAAPHLGGAAELARALGPWIAAALIIAAAAWFIWQRTRRVA